ncbi:MAG: hypothetical protein WBV62_05960, partial [Roseobacter sp.]
VNEALFLQGYTTLQSSEAEDGTTDTRGFLPAIVREIAPRDGIERMLAVQMATTHIALMRQGGRMTNADQLPQFGAHERACTTLARTYTAPGRGFAQAQERRQADGHGTVYRRTGPCGRCKPMGEGHI